MKRKRELLDLHVLVADRVIALSDAEFARESRYGVFIDADGVVARSRDRSGRALHESAHCRGCHAAYESAKRVTCEHGASTRENRKARISKGFEVEDARNANHGFEEQRKDDPQTTV
jgi:hypothetical protein